MEGSGSGHRAYGVVSGKGYNSNQRRYWNGAGSPESAPNVMGKDAETKRKKRIAKYKVYAVEGQVKATFRKGFRWIKNKCSQILHRY
ncbi:DUF3511 domain protein [Senna tora]|uniref:DUF3511 domain protein n=1 Tax=Senna tora TaxID=362788 RepID=A0A834SWN3_9FABA|nr:DUF3511 domain protein [Senna tora]